MGTVQNIRIKPSNVTWNSVDLGYLEGEIAMKLSEKTKEILVQQNGEVPIGEIRTGNSLEVTLKLKESSVANLIKFFGVGGSTYTPTGTGATPATGWGTKKLGTGTFSDAKRLTVRSINPLDHSEDITVWKAYPLIDELVFSGTDFQLIPLTFKCYVDPTKPAEVSLFMVGDSTQTIFNDV